VTLNQNFRLVDVPNLKLDLIASQADCSGQPAGLDFFTEIGPNAGETTNAFRLRGGAKIETDVVRDASSGGSVALATCGTLTLRFDSNAAGQFQRVRPDVVFNQLTLSGAFKLGGSEGLQLSGPTGGSTPATISLQKPGKSARAHRGESVRHRSEWTCGIRVVRRLRAAECGLHLRGRAVAGLQRASRARRRPATAASPAGLRVADHDYGSRLEFRKLPSARSGFPPAEPAGGSQRFCRFQTPHGRRRHYRDRRAATRREDSSPLLRARSLQVRLPEWLHGGAGRLRERTLRGDPESCGRRFRRHHWRPQFDGLARSARGHRGGWHRGLHREGSRRESCARRQAFRPRYPSASM